MLFEASSFTNVKSITSLRQYHASSKNDQHNVDIVPCNVDEPICTDNETNTENPFCFLTLLLLPK